MDKKQQILDIVSYVLMGMSIIWGIILFVTSYVAAISTIIISIIFLSPHIRRFIIRDKRIRVLATVVIFPIIFVMITYTALLHEELKNKTEKNNPQEDISKVENKSDIGSDNKNTSNNIEDKSKEFKKLFDDLKILSEPEKEIYVTDTITVGSDGDVSPGIYDMKIIGGNGNIFAKGNYGNTSFINWIGYSEGSSFNTDPSVFRVILLKGDTLEFKNISKIKLSPIKDFVKDNKLYNGTFLVGNDINPGTYKLSTNANLNPKYELGWNINIYNDYTGKTKSHRFNFKNNDVVIKLEVGDIIFTTFNNTDRNYNPDDARLIFTKV